MTTIKRTSTIDAEHGVICDYRNDFFGYFAWPSIAKADDGALYVAASGLRNRHVGPYGRNVLFTSADEGRNWSSPRVVNDSPLDDRDTGIVCFPGSNRMLISWFAPVFRRLTSRQDLGDEGALLQPGFTWITDKAVAACFGSWVKVSEDGGLTWSNPIRSRLTAPHGPILLADGSLLYFGKVFTENPKEFGSGAGAIQAARSTDNGYTWEALGTVPLIDGTSEENYHEPHIVELEDGKLVGLIRVQNRGEEHSVEAVGIPTFSLAQTVSTDGGRTFSRAESLGFHGSPPHLLRHSSGALVAVYGYRLQPYGQRAAISTDGGSTWEYDYILRDDGPDHDLGYPASVELADGSILTIYYQKIGTAAEQCSLLWTRWRLP